MSGLFPIPNNGLANSLLRPSRHRVFVSFHSDDRDWAVAFRDVWGTENSIFHDRSENEDLRHLSDEVIKKRLWDRFRNTTITVILIGPGTGGRAWVDQEIWYSLEERQTGFTTITRNGLLVIPIPDVEHWVPKRLASNSHRVVTTPWPTKPEQVQVGLEAAYQLRSNKTIFRDPPHTRKSNWSMSPKENRPTVPYNFNTCSMCLGLGTTKLQVGGLLPSPPVRPSLLSASLSGQSQYPCKPCRGIGWMSC
jgi:hypothetical protein